MTVTPSRHRVGISLIDVLVVMGVACLLVFLFLPSLTKDNRHRRPREFQCFSNLKQMALGAVLWISDRESDLPWRVPASRTGTLEFAESSDVFRHFAIMSNELNNPKILVCPTDKRRAPSADFSQLANANLSYFVNVNAASNSPVSPLFGDRNITGGSTNRSFLRTISSTNDLGWTKALHQHLGVIAFTDGSVQPISTQGLHELVITNPLPLRLALP